MVERWRPIVGFPDYLISDFGRVKSLSRDYKYGSHGDLILKISFRKNGYGKVDLYRDRKAFTKSIHRLVAEAFIPNPNNLPEVNHKDEDKANNFASNLEWCTTLYNNNYGSHCQKLSESVSRKVAQYSIDGELLEIWDSATVAAKRLNIVRQGISRACKTGLSAGGYKWRLIE